MNLKKGISVIIPTLGKSKQLIFLLQSLEKQKIDIPFEVLLIENSLDRKTKKSLEKLKQDSKLDLKIFFLENRGVNYARNFGLECSQYSLLFFIDDDCWIQDSLLLSKHWLLHEFQPSIFAFGGYYHLCDTTNFFDRCYHIIQIKWLQAGLYDLDRSTRYLIGGHFSLKKSISSRYQLLFDPQIIYGGSELGFFNKAFTLGLKMKLENLFVIHCTQETIFSLTRKLYKQGIGKAIVAAAGIPLLEVLTEKQKLNSSLFTNILEGYLALVFWFGYFRKNKDFFGFMHYLIENCFLFFKSKKQVLILKAKNELKKKIDRGDIL